MKFFALVFVAVFAIYVEALPLKPTSDDPYERIGVDPGASDDAVESAYRAAVMLVHPDHGGTVEDFRNVFEAGQFLKANRIYYDRRLIPFHGVYKKEETRPVPLAYEEILKYQVALLSYVRAETRARELAGPNPENHPTFILYAMLNLRGDHANYRAFLPWKLRAYRELLYHLDLLRRLNRAEVSGIVLNDPVEALSRLLEHYDNFNVRRRTLGDLFMAYDTFYVQDEDISQKLIGLLSDLEHSRMLHEPRFAAIREAAVTSLKKWVVGYYYELPRQARSERAEDYVMARNLILSLQPTSGYLKDCGRLLLGRGF